MKIQSIKLVNYKLFRNCVIEFNGDHCVFAGVNGSGKSSILDALALSLSWFLKSLQKSEKRGQLITYNHISKGEDFCEIEINVEHQDRFFPLSLKSKFKNQGDKIITNVSGQEYLTHFIRNINRYSLVQSDIVVAYYSVNRSATGEVPIIPDSSMESGWELYESALERKTGFNSFFDWFRLQDDMMKDKRLSQEDWMRRNIKEINQKYGKIIESSQAIFLIKKPLYGRSRVHSHNTLDNEELFWNNPHRYFYYLVDIAHELTEVLQIDFSFVDFILELEHAILRSADYQDGHMDNEHRYESFAMLLDIIGRHLDRFNQSNLDEYVNQLLWNIIDFSINIGVWWVGDTEQKRIDTILQKYKEMFLTRNVSYWKLVIAPQLLQIVRNEDNRTVGRKNKSGREVWIITKAINSFMPEYTNFRIVRTPKSQFMVDKNDETFPFHYLSDGERCLIAMIGDIARRLTIANTDSPNPLQGEGIVLIDEIELHLHPKWQRVLLEQFHSVFPNCQLIASTHSPQIISNVAQNNLYVLQDGEVIRSDHSYGRTSNRILEDIMDTDARPRKIKEELEELFRLIERKDWRKSRILYNDLKTKIGSDPDLVRADVLIRRLERKERP